jgi:hypothetical protein
MGTEDNIIRNRPPRCGQSDKLSWRGRRKENDYLNSFEQKDSNIEDICNQENDYLNSFEQKDSNIGDICNQSESIEFVSNPDAILYELGSDANVEVLKEVSVQQNLEVQISIALFFFLLLLWRVYLLKRK